MSTTTPRTRALVAVGASAGGLLGAALFLMRHTRVVVDERHVTLRSPSQYALRCVRHLVALSNAVGNLDWRRVRTHSQRLRITLLLLYVSSLPIERREAPRRPTAPPPLAAAAATADADAATTDVAPADAAHDAAGDDDDSDDDDDDDTDDDDNDDIT